MGIDFRFYLNRQGIQGKRGQRGEQGFSPLISVKTQTANEYVLTVQNEDGSFDTPNLRGNAIANTGGTYIRYNPVTGEMYTDDADYATTTQAGVVLLSTYAQLEAGGSEDLIPTSADVYDLVQAQMASIGQGYVTQTEFDNYTAATALTLNGIAGDISALDTGKMSFTDLVSSLVQGDNVTLVADAENKTITINAAGSDLSNYVDKTTDQTIDGFKTFLKSPILKGTNNSTLAFHNGNNNTEVARLQYLFDNNRFTISSIGTMYLQTANKSISVDDLLTSSTLTNVVTTNTSQNISGLKTFTNLISIKEGSINPSLSFLNLSGQQRANIYYDTAVNKFFLYSSGDLILQDGNTSRSLSNIQQTTNLVTSVDSSSTDSQYPSAKLFYDTVGDIESTLDAIIAGGNNTVTLTVVLAANPQYLTSFTFDGDTYSLSDFTDTGSNYTMTLQITSNVNHSWSVSATYGATPSSGTVNVNSNSTLNITVLNNGSGSNTPM